MQNMFRPLQVDKGISSLLFIPVFKSRSLETKSVTLAHRFPTLSKQQSPQDNHTELDLGLSNCSIATAEKARESKLLIQQGPADAFRTLLPSVLSLLQLIQPRTTHTHTISENVWSRAWYGSKGNRGRSVAGSHNLHVQLHQGGSVTKQAAWQLQEKGTFLIAALCTDSKFGARGLHGLWVLGLILSKFLYSLRERKWCCSLVCLPQCHCSMPPHCFGAQKPGTRYSREFNVRVIPPLSKDNNSQSLSILLMLCGLEKTLTCIVSILKGSIKALIFWIFTLVWWCLYRFA